MLLSPCPKRYFFLQLVGRRQLLQGKLGSMPGELLLSRELLRWLQSLDLAYSIKNAKRDFANGFLIGEILSRYYDRDIQMHSFDNGTSITIRKDNWTQLSKFFRKQAIDVITQAEIDRIIHCETGVAIEFLNRLYQKLTGRQVQEVERTWTDDDPPPFARATASRKVLERARQADLLENEDGDTRQAQQQETNAGHEQSLTADRAADPERYSALAPQSSKVLRGDSRTMTTAPAGDSAAGGGAGGGRGGTEGLVREIQVKKVSSSRIMEMRARQMGGGGSAAPSPSGRGGGMGGGGGGGGGGGRGGRPLESASDVLGRCVNLALEGHPLLASFGPESDPMDALVEAATSPTAPEACPDELAAAVFAEVGAASAELADAAVGAPRDFWRATSVLHAVLQGAAAESALFGAATAAYGALGRAMLARDPTAAAALFAEYSLPRLCALLAAAPAKRHDALRVAYAFVANDCGAHIAFIRRLQEGVAEMPTFVHALTILILMERRMDEALLDLYLYYCVIGLSMSSPALRAASVAMLAVVGQHAPGMVLEMMARLTVMAAEETWWEVHAQLLVVAGTLLADLEADAAEAAELIEGVVGRVFTPSASLNIRKVGLQHLMRAVERHAALLLPRYTEVLCSLDASSRPFLLSTSADDAEELPVAGASGGKYRLAPLPLGRAWPGLPIARQIAARIVAEQPEHMELGEIQGLLAAMTGGSEAEDADMGAWVDVFQSVRDYIFVALCDGDCCDVALEVLRKLVAESPLGESVLAESTLLGSLRLLFPDGGSGAGGQDEEERGDMGACQEQVKAFLEELWGQGQPFAGAVEALLAQFEADHPEQFGPSILAPLAAQLRDGRSFK